MIKAVIFDLDGTLLYTLKGLSNACNMALEKMGLPPIKTNSYKYLVGCGADKLMEGMLRTVKHKAEEEEKASKSKSSKKMTKLEREKLIEELEAEMKAYAKELNFEMAAQVRDAIMELKKGD